MPIASPPRSGGLCATALGFQLDSRSICAATSAGPSRGHSDPACRTYLRYCGGTGASGRSALPRLACCARGDRAAGSRRGHHDQAHAAHREQRQHDAGGDEQPPAAAALLAFMADPPGRCASRQRRNRNGSGASPARPAPGRVRASAPCGAGCGVRSRPGARVVSARMFATSWRVS